MHSSHGVTNSTFSCKSSVVSPALGQGVDAGLKELVRREPEEVRHAIQMAKLQLARALEELVDVRRMHAHVQRQRLLIFFTHAEQFRDV